MKIINISKGVANEYFHVAGLRAGDSFTENKQRFLVVTDEQAASFERVVRHQGRENYKAAYYDFLGNFLAVNFTSIFIGIEPDGYAHS